MLSKSADQKKLIWTSLIQLVPAQSHLYIQYCIYESWVITKNKRLPAGLEFHLRCLFVIGPDGLEGDTQQPELLEEWKQKMGVMPCGHA
jgi:hypothetical protein